MYTDAFGKDVDGIMVSSTENGICNPGSNSGHGSLDSLYTNALAKGMNPSLLFPAELIHRSQWATNLGNGYLRIQNQLKKYAYILIEENFKLSFMKRQKLKTNPKEFFKYSLDKYQNC